MFQCLFFAVFLCHVCLIALFFAKKGPWIDLEVDPEKGLQQLARALENFRRGGYNNLWSGVVLGHDAPCSLVHKKNQWGLAGN